MKAIKLAHDQQWIRRSEAKYGLRTVTHCGCGLSKVESLIIEGESHDDEPWLSMGNYRCNSCGIYGYWEPAPDTGQVVGDTGIATPDKIILQNS
ncbi:hypothetical protein [Janthinobacterium agaricidamnosum]|uniref:hypothetical protein n=1 Tax=Janthinobacterium agaricidamnosum TaxID=55508 RepID=UPI0011859903|nr:hypothetical protein [Janthinobacterium agaricidamnosum]